MWYDDGQLEHQSTGFRILLRLTLEKWDALASTEPCYSESCKPGLVLFISQPSKLQSEHDLICNSYDGLLLALAKSAVRLNCRIAPPFPDGWRNRQLPCKTGRNDRCAGQKLHAVKMSVIDRLRQGFAEMQLHRGGGGLPATSVSKTLVSGNPNGIERNISKLDWDWS